MTKSRVQTLLEQAAEGGSATAAVQLDRAHGRRSRERTAERKRQERLKREAEQAMQRKGTRARPPDLGSATVKELRSIRAGLDEAHWDAHGDKGEECERCMTHAQSVLASLRLDDAGFFAVWHPGEPNPFTTSITDQED